MHEAFIRCVLPLALGWTVAGWIGGVSSPALAAARPRNVLIVYTSGRLLPANIEADRGFREAIVSSDAAPIDVYDEHLDLTRFEGDAFARTVVAYLREKYATHAPDVIVAAGDGALVFLLEHRAALFPLVPIVHAGVSPEILARLRPIGRNTVGVAMELEFRRTIEQALLWHPRVTRLVVVTGASPADRLWEARLRKEVERFRHRVTPEFLAGLPTKEVSTRLAALGGDAVVFTPGYYRDGAGRNSWPRDSVAAMATIATAPVYNPLSTAIGLGVVGGYVPSFRGVGRQGGEFVTALLAGTPIESLRADGLVPTHLEVDWRQVRRWGIEEGSIPRGSVVRFREATFLEAHGGKVFGAAVVFSLQASMIAWLLAERRRRRVAEGAEADARRELAHASRLALAGELTAAIAHEVNQPLCAILANADAADLVLESGADRKDLLRSILADIRRDDLRASEVISHLRTLLAKQEMNRAPLDLNDTLADANLVLRSEAKRRHVRLEIRQADAPVRTMGDRIQVQQVLLNLAFNAMEAVSALPEIRRRVTVSVEPRDGAVGMIVQDDGDGIAPEHLPRLFESFFTTKESGMGLGLSIARTIVEAHGGRIRAGNGEGGGAVFDVELPAAPGAPVARLA